MNNIIFLFTSFLFFLCLSKSTAQILNKVIEYEFEVNANPQEAYNAWTTVKGIESFFAPKCELELKLFGKYHILFFPNNEIEKRGAEDEIILSNIKDKMISFTWGFPYKFTDLRSNQKTIVNIRFTDLGNNRAKVHFSNTGWGEGEEWDVAYNYFVTAWGNVVLARYQSLFIYGPANWDSLSDFSEFFLAKDKME